MPRLTNDAVMERYGYRLCSNCNSDMPVDGFVAGWCKGCVDSEQEAK